MKTLKSDLKRIEKKIRDNGEFALRPVDSYKSLLIPIVSSNMDDVSDMINMIKALNEISNLILNESFDMIDKRSERNLSSIYGMK